MSQCDPNNCDHSSHVAEVVDVAAIAKEAALEAPVAPSPQIETAASKRFDQLASVKARREVVRAEVERRRVEGVEVPPPPAPPKPEYEPSDTVKGAQRTLESIEKRKRIRALMIAEKLRRGVEIEGELRQAAKDRDARLEAVEAKARQELAAISEAFQDLAGQRAIELNVRENEIAKLDSSLVQLRKQLDAELGKLDPDLARPRKGE